MWNDFSKSQLIFLLPPLCLNDPRDGNIHFTLDLAEFQDNPFQIERVSTKEKKERKDKLRNFCREEKNQESLKKKKRGRGGTGDALPWNPVVFFSQNSVHWRIEFHFLLLHHFKNKTSRARAWKTRESREKDEATMNKGLSRFLVTKT